MEYPKHQWEGAQTWGMPQIEGRVLREWLRYSILGIDCCQRSLIDPKGRSQESTKPSKEIGTITKPATSPPDPCFR